jgi:mRNA interferase MazF
MGVVGARRGEAWWVDLPAPTGSEPAYRRPAVVISDDRFNASRLNTITVVAVTSNLARAKNPGNVLLNHTACGLDRPSVVNVTQVLTLDRQRLTDKIGILPRGDLLAVDDGLRLALHL